MWGCLFQYQNHNINVLTDLFRHCVFLALFLILPTYIYFIMPNKDEWSLENYVFVGSYILHMCEWSRGLRHNFSTLNLNIKMNMKVPRNSEAKWTTDLSSGLVTQVMFCITCKVIHKCYGNDFRAVSLPWAQQVHRDAFCMHLITIPDTSWSLSYSISKNPIVLLHDSTENLPSRLWDQENIGVRRSVTGAAVLVTFGEPISHLGNQYLQYKANVLIFT